MVSTGSIPSSSVAVVKISSDASVGRHSRVAFGFQNPLSNPAKPLFPLCKAHPRQRISVHRCVKVCAHLDEVVGSSSTDGAASKSKSGAFEATGKEAESAEEYSPLVPMSEEAVSEFLTQVASLVKLVDSRDVAELQLKKLDCELIIRKKEAQPQSPTSAPVVMMRQPPPAEGIPSQYMQFSAPSTSPAADASSSPPPSPAPKSAKSLHPPLKSPMAGTFYRNPAPGTPPFVKVGDQVKKGQVLCIIEAMKLMNEIEADHAGKVTEILVDDGKTVSVDQPLFVIEP